MNIKKNRPIKNIICISDTHCGCRLGLACPTSNLDDGGEYKHSKLQAKVWSMWEQFWGEWVPIATKGEPYIVVHNGDAIDGSHHGSTTQISQNIGDQVELAYKILSPVVELCEGRYYHIRGTEAHVGQSGVNEEALAKRLRAIPNGEGQHARWELWKNLGDKMVHFLHHIGTTASSAHESSALNAEMVAMFVEAGRWNRKCPSAIVRSHRHRSMEVRMPVASGYATVVVTPAWQLKTPFVYKIPGARLSQPQIGGILIRHGDRELFTDSKVWSIEPPKAE